MLNKYKIKYLKNSIIVTTLAAFLACNLVLLVFSNVFMMNKSSQNLIDMSNKHIEQLINKATHDMEEALEKVRIPLVLLTSNADIVEYMQRYDRMTDYEKLVNKRKLNNTLINMTTSHEVISDILLIAKDGHYTNMTGGNGLKWDYDFTDEKWVEQLMSSQSRKLNLLGLQHQEYYYSQEKQVYGLSLGIPVLNQNKTIIGVILCNLDIKEFVNILTRTNDSLGETYIVDNEDTIIVHSDDTKIGTKISADYNKFLSTSTSGNFEITIGNKGYLVTYNTSEATQWKIVSDISMDVIKGYSAEMEVYMKGILFISVVLNIILSIIISYNLYKPLKRLIHKIRTTKDKNVAKEPIDFKYSELNVISRNFDVLVYELEELIKKNYKSKLDLKDAQFNALCHQINPHFLFNTLQILQTEIIYGHVEESNDIVLALGELLRYSTYNNNAFVRISEELYYIESYCNIFQKKYDNKIQFRVEAPDEVLDYYMPKLLLQPIVENSIKHGFSIKQNDLEIVIKITLEREQIKIRIEDNGVGIDHDTLNQIKNSLLKRKKSKNKIGLVNINERIKLMFGEAYAMKIDSKLDVFTIIELILPKIKSIKEMDNLQQIERNVQ